MRVGLDVRMIDQSGIGTTIRNLLGHLSDERRRQLVLFGQPGAPETSVPVPWPVYGFSQHWRYPKLIAEQKLDLFHLPHYDVPLFYRGPFVATVYDLIHFLFPEYSTKPFTRFYSRVLLRHVARHARRIIVISKQTEADLVRFFPEAKGKTRLIYPAVDCCFMPVDPTQAAMVAWRYGLKPGYFLYVGNLRASKNSPLLLAAYERLRAARANTPPLVLVGRNFYPEWERRGFPTGVTHLGKVPLADLPALYSAAALFVFPSLYEGFGLPPLEAMVCGTPVITSSVASLPEACGEAAVYVNPRDENGLAQAMARLLDDPSKRARLRAAGFKTRRDLVGTGGRMKPGRSTNPRWRKRKRND